MIARSCVMRGGIAATDSKLSTTGGHIVTGLLLLARRKLAILAACAAFLGFVPATLAGDHDSAALGAQESLDRLVEGNARFARGESAPVDLSTGRIEELSKGQKPFAVIVSCSDSRVPPEHVFNAGLGEVFVIRMAGNVVEADAIASVEYAVAHLGTRLIVVMGHESCGAVGAAAAHAHDTPAIEALVSKIIPAVDAATAEGLKDKSLTERAIVINAANTRDALSARSALLREQVAKNGLKIADAKYMLHGGKVE